MALYPNSKHGYWEYGNSGYPLVGGLAENVIEDFEDNSLSEYGGDVGDFTTQKEHVLKGRYSLRSQDTWATIGDNGGDFPTPRTSLPTEYRARMYFQDAGWAAFLVSVQRQSSPFRNCYFVALDTEHNDFWLIARIDGSNDTLHYQSLSISQWTEYQPFITLSDDGINGGLRDQDGREIYRSPSFEERRLSGGGLGWRAGSASPVLFDQATFHTGSMDEFVNKYTYIDNFEDGNIREYNIRYSDSDASQSAEPAAALFGDYGLQMYGNGQIYSDTSMGLDNYIRDTVPIELFFSPHVADSACYQILLCPFYHGGSSMDYFYYVEMRMSYDDLRIRKYHNGDEWTLHGSGTNEAHYAQTTALNWQKDKWYRLEITLDQSAPSILVKAYEHATDSYMAYVEQTDDSEYMSDENGLGFACTNYGHMYVDDVREVE